MMDYDLLFPGRFLKAGEFGGKDVTLTIASIETEQLPQDKGGEKLRGILGFKETPKKFVLNRTNGECLKALWGRETDKWIGHRITLYPEIYKGDLAIRVKGSPELEAEKAVEIKLPRKKATVRTLYPTGRTRKREPGED